MTTQQHPPNFLLDQQTQQEPCTDTDNVADHILNSTKDIEAVLEGMDDTFNVIEQEDLIDEDEDDPEDYKDYHCNDINMLQYNQFKFNCEIDLAKCNNYRTKNMSIPRPIMTHSAPNIILNSAQSHDTVTLAPTGLNVSGKSNISPNLTSFNCRNSLPQSHVALTKCSENLYIKSTTKTSPQKSPTSAEQSSAEEKKNARKRRTEKMIQRKLGSHQKRRERRLLVSLFGSNEEEMSAALSAELNMTQGTVADKDIATTAFQLIHSVCQVEKNPSTTNIDPGKKSKKKRKVSSGSKSSSSKDKPSPPVPVKSKYQLDEITNMKERRAIRNRLSARYFRDKLRLASEEKEKKVKALETEVESLKKELNNLQTKTVSLQTSLDVLYHHFGHNVIDNVLKSNGKALPSEFVSIHVSDSSSSLSNSRSDVEFITPPVSPKLELVNTVTEVDGRPRRRIPLSPFSSETSTPQPKRMNKKSRTTAFLMSMACCAFLGCVAIFSPNPSVFSNNQWTPNEEPVIILSSGKNYHDTRRRLTGGSNRKKHDWVISPIEMYPAQWKVNHNYPFGSPWTAQRSQTLFDLRSIDTNTEDVDSSLNTLFSDIEEDKDEKELPDNKMDHSNKLRGRKPPYNSSTYQDEDSRSISASSSSKPFLPIPFSEYDIGTDLNVGASYVFAPVAHASLSPNVIELMDIANATSIMDSKLSRSADTINRNTMSILDSKLISKDRNIPFVSNRMSSLSKPKIDSLVNLPEGEPVKKRTKIIIENMSILLPLSILSQEQNDLIKESQTGNNTKHWVEFDCQVTSARLVDGVEFTGNTSPE